MYRQKERNVENGVNPWYYNYIAPRNSPDPDDKHILSKEWKFAVFGLIFSMSVLSAKILHSYSSEIYSIFVENRLIAYETVVTDGDILLKYAWKNVVRYSQYWFPALCGALTTWFTWLMVYLDSSVPGVQPPSPLSPSKYKERSGHTFHLNYIFAVAVGVLVFIYMFMKGTTLQF